MKKQAVREFHDELRLEAKTALRLVGAGSGHVHLVGACGVGMAGLAFHLARRGLRVSGCDVSPGPLASWLREHGVRVERGHDSAHLSDADWIVRSAAVRPDHPEVRTASASGLPVLRRGAVLAALSAGRDSVIVSGTHGKTTTAAMTVQVLRAGGIPPSFCIGGDAEMLGGVAGIGSAGVMVAEADESDGTLACYEPDVAVITNIEFDHAEFFDSLDALLRCFSALAGRVRDRIIYCADDHCARQLLAGMKKTFAYGFSDASDLQAYDYSATGGSARFGVKLRGTDLGVIALRVPGRHNVLNALAACSVALMKNVPFPRIQNGLGEFMPVRRRFERIFENDEVVVISDYAHHPTEITALLECAKSLKRSRLLAVFQPHRFSRTRALADEFSKAFSGIDRLVLVPVYAASEQPIAGGASWDLYGFLRDAGVRVSCARSLRQAWNYLHGELRTGDALLIIGAGDVSRIGDWAGSALSPGIAGYSDRVGRWESELKGLGLRATRLAAREPMAGKTTLLLGGRADIFADVGCESDLARILEWAWRCKAPSGIIGRGSNMLVSDLGFRGIVIRLKREGFGLIREDASGCLVCGAAVTLNAVVEWTAKNGKSGLLFLSGIPGTVGGALKMNAGAWGASIGERTAWVRTLKQDGSAETLSKEALEFSYRQCDSLKGRVVVEAGFVIENGDAADIRDTLAGIAEKRAWMNGMRSAGSVFRNPESGSAGRLIERAGLKGLRIGGARVSETHANVIVTEAGATASDVNALIEIVRSRVLAASGVSLVKEIVSLE